MKAIRISQPGPPEVLKIAEVQIPDIQDHEVLIEVRAAGVNRPDVIQRKGVYPAPPGVVQDIPGLEVAGTIVKLGSEVANWKIGDSVCALIAGGGYSEYVACDSHHCLPIPATLSFAEAASLPETVYTVWHNVFQRGRLERGETFLIHGGSSGIGITAIQLANLFGAHVFATAGTDAKCRICEGLGAKRCINYNKEDFQLALKDIGVDVILDMIGGDYINKNINLLRPDGRLVFINAMKGGTGSFDALDVMRRRLTITGSTLRARDAAFKAQLTDEVRKQVWPLLISGAFKPLIFETFTLEEASKAHELMESSNHIGKIVLAVK